MVYRYCGVSDFPFYRRTDEPLNPFFLNQIASQHSTTIKCFSQPLIQFQPPALPTLGLGQLVAVVPSVGAVQWLNAGGQSKILFAMNNYQNSQDFIQRMNLLLDNQLTPEKEREMLEEIKTNKNYRALLSQEQSFREFVKSRIHRKKVSPSLVQSIKEKIHSSGSSEM